MPSGPDAALTPAERERLAALRSAESLADLVGLTGADSTADAYVTAKRAWAALREKELAAHPPVEGLPGERVVVDDHEFWVHGITHAGTPQERRYLREHVARLLDRGAAVFCEQGVRSMYFADLDDVREIDDYHWAMQRYEELAPTAHPDRFPGPEVSGLLDDVESLASAFREGVFSLIDSGGDLYGEAFEATLGDLASTFLLREEQLATGEDFESFRKTRRASRNPQALVDLQQYYDKAFLPQPVEREWLRRHDPELEVITHARNERMADYAVAHADAAEAVHLLVGAAHQPGVVYYLRQHRDGERRLEDFRAFD